MISGEFVEKACLEVGQYTEEEMANEFDRFFRTQPALCEFVVEATHESGQKIQELSLFLSFMVFKTVEGSEASTPGTVQPDSIEAACRETESWMTLLSQSEDRQMQESVAQSLEQDTEPYLLQYVISELNDPVMDDGSELNDEEKGEVFFVLKTVISSLCSGANPESSGSDI